MEGAAARAPASIFRRAKSLCGQRSSLKHHAIVIEQSKITPSITDVLHQLNRVLSNRRASFFR